MIHAHPPSPELVSPFDAVPGVVLDASTGAPQHPSGHPDDARSTITRLVLLVGKTRRAVDAASVLLASGEGARFDTELNQSRRHE